MQGAIGLGPWYVLVRLAVKAEVSLGLCATSADSLGMATQPLVQVALADTMVYLLSTHAVRGNHRAAARHGPEEAGTRQRCVPASRGVPSPGLHPIRPAR